MIYLKLLWIFFKIGLFTVGGGYAMIPLIEREIVEAGYMSSGEVYDLVAISQITPGAFALNASTFCGMKIAGIMGAVISTVGLILPSLIITSVVAIFFFRMAKTNFFKRLFMGMKPATIGLIGSTVVIMIVTICFKLENVNNGVQILQQVSKMKIDIVSVLIATLSTIAIIKLKAHPVLVILFGGLVGGLYYPFVY